MKKRSFEGFVKRLEELGLFEPIEKRARAAAVTMRDLYEGLDRAPSVIKARKEVYTWLVEKKNKGLNEVARIFDRAPSGISKLLGKD